MSVLELESPSVNPKQMSLYGKMKAFRDYIKNNV